MGKFFKKIFGTNKKNKEESPSDISQSKDTESSPLKKEVPELSLHIIPAIDDSTPTANDNQTGSFVNEQTSEVDFELSDYQYPRSTIFSKAVLKIFLFLHESPSDCELPILWSFDEQKNVLNDLAELKNIIVAGTQESGKSNFIHQIILSILIKKHPSDVKFVLIDIKGLEFNIYSLIERHFLARLPGQEQAVLKSVDKVLDTLNGLCLELDFRYDMFSTASVRNISEYNARFKEGKLNPKKGHKHLPRIVVVIDDLGGYTYNQSDIVTPLVRLVNDGYKAGIYTVISTSQTVGHVLPNNLLSMINQRVVFRLNSKEEYRKFFDTTRFEISSKQGSFLYNNSSKIFSGQTVLIPFTDIQEIIEFIGRQKGYPSALLIPEFRDDVLNNDCDFNLENRDPLFEDAARMIVQSQMGSTSLLQRRMKLGYNRAGRLMDQLETAGIVGPSIGSKARDVLIKTETDLDRHLHDLG
jgi:DNA segregation ATPase FtsK/SpoIIIE, S-DNA-T family